jgi:hypothetical protein
MHPVLESLRNTDRQWLIDTLYAFNSGDVDRFQTLKTAWGQQVGPTCLWPFLAPTFVNLPNKCSVSVFSTHGKHPGGSGHNGTVAGITLTE